MLKELKTLLQKYFGTSSPKPIEIKKPTPVKVVQPREKLNSLVEEISKDMFSIMSRQSKGYGYVHHKATHRKRPGRHSKRPNKNSQITRDRGQGK
jgi:hypothetical protein